MPSGSAGSETVYCLEEQIESIESLRGEVCGLACLVQPTRTELGITRGCGQHFLNQWSLGGILAHSGVESANAQ